MLRRSLIWVVAQRWMSSEPTRVEKSVNKVVLIGRIGREPEMRGSQENPCTAFPLATSENFKDKTGEYQQKTQWHRIVIFRPWLKDTVYTYAKKGSRIYLEGKIEYGQYTDDDGNTNFTTSVVADDVIFLDHRSGDNY
ncbi:single-stranded DNA-binding protein, mitochondrial-like isoform X2 [Antedon mediterranea]|uniref:single-stranded DNA-binding protein, mitochondrial-like isoform X2 n=1 Tax=Antedon mediterranea TaxID=105859 RepID=UPI003AF452C9